MNKFKIFILCASIIFFYGCAGLNGKDKLEDLSGKVTTLRSSLENTNAKIEDLNNKILLLNEKIETLRQNADKASAINAAPLPPEGLKIVSLGQEGEKKEGQSQKKTAVDAPAPVSEGPAVKESPGDLYKRGQGFFNAGKYSESRAAFSAFLKSYPADRLANNTRYWIGESYYSERAFERALQSFEEVANKYPGDNKAPDCLFKAGLSYIEINNNEKARESLGKLTRLYPGSETAEKAKKTHNKISNEKRKGTR